MNFSSPDKVLAPLSAGDEADRIRAENRVKINEAANGFPPFDLDTAKKQNLKVNVNWGELAVLFSHALQQLTNAFPSSSKPKPRSLRKRTRPIGAAPSRIPSPAS